MFVCVACSSFRVLHLVAAMIANITVRSKLCTPATPPSISAIVRLIAAKWAYTFMSVCSIRWCVPSWSRVVVAEDVVIMVWRIMQTPARRTATRQCFRRRGTPFKRN